MHQWNAKNECLPLHDVINVVPELKQYVKPHPRKQGRYFIDLGDPNALLAYNKALLLSLEGLVFDLPKDALIPSICFRRTILKVIFTKILPAIPSRMLEIGIGRSAIISMIAAKRWGVEAWGTDLEEVLKWAHHNIQKNRLEKRIHLLPSPESSLLTDLPLDLTRMDVIFSNPPYYANSDEHLLNKHRGFQGHQHELIAGKSPLSFVNSLLLEWNDLERPAPLAMILPKQEWCENLIEEPMQVHLIKAGTRKRFLVFYQ